PTIVLVPYLKQHTKLPILAAGGISTGAQMVAALAMGACGVVSGTRFITSNEAKVIAEYKRAVIEAEPEDIVCTDRITGNPSNWIGKSIQGIEAGPELGSRKWIDMWSAGQSVAQADSIKPAGEIIREMVEGYFEAISRLQSTITAN
ncbi:nitronate monooxygenase, partial [bacterium]|nr:nitronate monooxygenase [bacterium]